MSFSTDALVLRCRDVSEHDKVLTLLSKEYGVLSVFANGARHLKSKLASGCATFTYSHFEIKKRGEYSTVAIAEPLEMFYGLHSNMEQLALASYMAQLIQSFIPEEKESGDFLRLILNSFYLMQNGNKSYAMLKAIFELRLISMAGFMPNLIGCRNCGEFDPECGMSFDYTNGNLICHNCIGDNSDNNHMIKLTRGVLSAMRHIVYSDTNKLFSFTVSKESEVMLGKICETYLLSRSERGYKALEFYKSML